MFFFKIREEKMKNRLLVFLSIVGLFASAHAFAGQSWTCNFNLPNHDSTLSSTCFQGCASSLVEAQALALTNCQSELESTHPGLCDQYASDVNYMKCGTQEEENTGNKSDKNKNNGCSCGCSCTIL